MYTRDASVAEENKLHIEGVGSVGDPDGTSQSRATKAENGTRQNGGLSRWWHKPQALLLQSLDLESQCIRP